MTGDLNRCMDTLMYNLRITRTYDTDDSWRVQGTSIVVKLRNSESTSSVGSSTSYWYKKLESYRYTVLSVLHVNLEHVFYLGQVDYF